MAEAGAITPEQRTQARRRLAASGAWGISISGEELVAMAAESEWLLTRSFAGALRDRAVWRADAGSFLGEICVLLDTVHRARPDLLCVWVQRALDAAGQALPEMPDWRPAEAMIVLAWDPVQSQPRVSRECLQQLIECARALPALMRIGYDPLLNPLARMLAAAPEATEEQRVALFRLCLARLRGRDTTVALSAFVR